MAARQAAELGRRGQAAQEVRRRRRAGTDGRRHRRHDGPGFGGAAAKGH
jgi:hypothetical protein